MADFSVVDGVVRPKIFVINTRDSAIWLDGSASLPTETLDLRAVVWPKDFSPLTLRTPVHLRGNLSIPAVSLELGKPAGKAGIAGLLAVLNPLAATIPFIDPGADEEAKRDGAECATLVQKLGWISKPMQRPSTTRVPTAAAER